MNYVFVSAVNGFIASLLDHLRDQCTPHETDRHHALYTSVKAFKSYRGLDRYTISAHIHSLKRT